jgi:hypothetical protein
MLTRRQLLKRGAVAGAVVLVLRIPRLAQIPTNEDRRDFWD